MRTPPAIAPNKHNLHGRVAEVEVVAANALTAAKEAHARLDRQPPQGERGGTGERGEAGRAGDAGKDGRDGRPGRDAVGIQGPQGRPGENGLDSIANPQRVAQLETKLSDARAEHAALVETVKSLSATVQGLIDVNKRTGEYITWLRERTAARIAAAQEKKQ
jgi:hypothetical protein